MIFDLHKFGLDQISTKGISYTRKNTYGLAFILLTQLYGDYTDQCTHDLFGYLVNLEGHT